MFIADVRRRYRHNVLRRRATELPAPLSRLGGLSQRKFEAFDEVAGEADVCVASDECRFVEQPWRIYIGFSCRDPAVGVVDEQDS